MAAARSAGGVKRKLGHLLLATLEDPYNPESWSGTPFALRSALEKQVERVSVCGWLKPRRNPVHAALRLALGGKPPRYPLWMTDSALRGFAEDTQAALDQHKPDALLCISSQRIIYLRQPQIPMFMFSDSPWLSWKETYRRYEAMPLRSKRFARLEAEVARRCDGMVYASEWARQEAIRLFGVSPSKVHAAPIGARWVPQISDQAVAEAIDRRSTERVDLLFVGKDWERKGAPLTIAIARSLHARGVPVTLHIVGGNPPIAPADEPFVKKYGFLSPRNPSQAETLHNLFLTSHFLVVPTQAECYGLVFAEAHAFGLPAVSCAVQAVPSIIADGQTGIVQPMDAPAEAYVDRLLPLVHDRAAYRRMAHAAQARYQTLLNWDCFTRHLIEQIEACL